MNMRWRERAERERHPTVTASRRKQHHVYPATTGVNGKGWCRHPSVTTESQEEQAEGGGGGSSRRGQTSWWDSLRRDWDDWRARNPRATSRGICSLTVVVLITAASLIGTSLEKLERCVKYARPYPTRVLTIDRQGVILACRGWVLAYVLAYAVLYPRGVKHKKCERLC